MIQRYRHIKDCNSIQILSKNISPLRRFSCQEFQLHYQSPYGFVYKITNLENDKIYVGQTIRCIANRFNSHILKTRYKSNSYLSNAFRKYGESAFEVEELCTCKTKEELNAKERYWIKKLKSNTKCVGYNMTVGGEFSPRTRYGKQQKRKQLSPEHIKKISMALIGHAPNYDISGKNNPMYKKCLFNTWLKRYGKKVALQKYNTWKVRCSTGQRLRWKVRTLHNG